MRPSIECPFVVLLLCLITAAFPDRALADSDIVQCTEDDKRILCNLTMPEFLETVRPILTNGWENTIQIHISLLNGSGEKTLRQSKLEATQRCYLDPFESPCLILWRGASNWLRYRDENTFLKAFSHFGIQAMTLTDLPADNYRVRMTIQVMPSAQKRLEAIKRWFKSDGTDSENGIWGSSNALIGSFLSSRAESQRSQSYEITLETAQFYIDLNFKAPEQEDETDDPIQDASSEDDISEDDTNEE